jgi:hypothetical protein
LTPVSASSADTPAIIPIRSTPTTVIIALIDYPLPRGVYPLERALSRVDSGGSRIVI